MLQEAWTQQGGEFYAGPSNFMTKPVHRHVPLFKKWFNSLGPVMVMAMY